LKNQLILGINKGKLKDIGATNIFQEITQQPNVWLSVLSHIQLKSCEINEFVSNVTRHQDFDVILIGAGSSEIVGKSALEVINTQLNNHAYAYSSTQIVMRPEKYITKNKPTLMISFARSGNSPESVAAINSANIVNNNIYHLAVSCNKNGNLAQYTKNQNNFYSLELPEKTNDKSFAMTSSFSSLYLTAITLFQLNRLDEILAAVKEINEVADRLCGQEFNFIKEIANKFDYKKTMFLGSGLLQFVAEESALKMLELNGGKILTFSNSPLGIRHGYKAIIDEQTLVVLFISDDPVVRLYEIDILRELRNRKNHNPKILVLANNDSEEIRLLSDYYYNYACKLNPITIKSGIFPDNPYPEGEMSRVVKGVTIYELTSK
jgi:tagatose-6-phosphate ketose/aldose isomerase